MCKFVAEDSLNEGGIIVQYALCTDEIFIDSMKIKLKKKNERKKKVTMNCHLHGNRLHPIPANEIVLMITKETKKKTNDYAILYI